jgi:coenzyme F420-reducing hydrogenase beta subunit
MKEDAWCNNCVYCEIISPYKYVEKSDSGEEYQGYCRKTGYYLLTVDDRVCEKYEEVLNEGYFTGNF